MNTTSMTIQTISTPLPLVNPKGEESPNNKPSMQEAFEKCATFTKQSGCFTFSPQSSAFLAGIRMMTKPDTQHFLTPLLQGCGLLLVLASPSIFAFKCLVGVPTTIAGAISTTILVPFYAAEKLAIKIKHHFQPSKAQLERKKHTENFVKRMQDLLKNFDAEKQKELIIDPAPLISLSITAVTFLSRNSKDNELNVSNQIIKLKDVKNMDDLSKMYFDKFLSLKSDINKLNLSLDDHHAWELFVHYLEAMVSENNPLDHFQKEIIQSIMIDNESLTKSIVADIYFQEAWTHALT